MYLVEDVGCARAEGVCVYVAGTDWAMGGGGSFFVAASVLTTRMEIPYAKQTQSVGVCFLCCECLLMAMHGSGCMVHGVMGLLCSSSSGEIVGAEWRLFRSVA